MSLRDFLFYEEPGIQVFCADCREVLPRMDLADAAIVTDPPYGISLDTRSRDESLADHDPIFGDDATFDPSWLINLELPTILWGANHYAPRLPISRGWLVWNKVIYDGAYGTRAMDKRQAECELAWTNALARPKGYRHLWDGVYRDSECGTRYHPAQKPVELMSWCIGLLPSQTIVDPYMGTGPTLIAAKNLSRRAIGIEIEPKYCEIAVKRLRQEVLAL